MNGWLFAAGSLAAATTLIHVIAGGRDVVRPLLGSSMEAEPRRTLHVVWHFVTVDLLLSAVALIVLALRAEPNVPLALFIAAHYVAYTAAFLVGTLTVGWSRPLLRLPQWMLLLPVGTLTVIGTL
ncbi:hypothetical protein JJV70_05365 [Streptomyces sp. JJ66]|uniref:hypothetical protein n=1 Tax=Streptomyces sp. JJ66 TaxID=2803843 RepID=UPI001C576937|nr:hypothetical protein [Streptomyces sp. JJ66]MBW1601545.1 hypothetical protein [Streptomyces sp. JJ66]